MGKPQCKYPPGEERLHETETRVGGIPYVIYGGQGSEEESCWCEAMKSKVRRTLMVCVSEVGDIAPFCCCRKANEPTCSRLH